MVDCEYEETPLSAVKVSGLCYESTIIALPQPQAPGRSPIGQGEATLTYWWAI